MKKIMMLLMCFLPITVLNAQNYSFQNDDSVYGMALSVGGTAYLPKSDYLSKMGGISFGLEGYVNKHVFGYDMQVNFGKCLEDVESHYGWIDEGTTLTNIQVLFNYGYIASRSALYQVYPFAGMGLSSFQDIRQDDEYYDYPYKMGFVIDAGFCYDIRLGNREWLRSAKNYTWESASCIRLRPFLTLTHYHGPMGWTPALNLSVSYLFGGLF